MEGKPKKVAMVTLGCKINQYDSSAIAEQLKLKGNRIVPCSPEAEVFIINTCTVTQRTDYKGRQMIRRAHSLNPDAILIVTGCYAQTQPGEIAKIPGVDYIFGNTEKEIIAPCLDTLEKHPVPLVNVGDHPTQICLEPAPLCSHSGHTRAFLKIQDGCNESCAYCIIPRARGRSRSLAPNRVLEQVRWLGSKGFKEVVLSGVHLGYYGHDISPRTTLFELLCAIEKQDIMPRVRISSIEPNELHDELLELFAEAHHLCAHFHLPMQSGDVTILEAMHRKYNPEDFQTLVYRIQKYLPDAAIGVDVIVGFPGEGDDEFQNTKKLIASLPVAYLHVFPYSNRPGTVASGLPHQVAPEEMNTRSLLLRDLGKEKRWHFYGRFIGRTLRILVESRRDQVSHMLQGFSRNYIQVLFEGGDEIQNEEVPVTLHKLHGLKVVGSISC